MTIEFGKYTTEVAKQRAVKNTFNSSTDWAMNQLRQGGLKIQFNPKEEEDLLVNKSTTGGVDIQS